MCITIYHLWAFSFSKLTCFLEFKYGLFLKKPNRIAPPFLTTAKTLTVALIGQSAGPQSPDRKCWVYQKVKRNWL